MSTQHVMQVPLPLARALHCGAETELLEERKAGATKPNFYLKVFDDYERKEKLKKMESDASVSSSRLAAESAYARKLQEARKTILEDDLIRKLLPTVDGILDVDAWPVPQALEQIVKKRAVLQGNAGDVEGAARLRSAFALHQQAIETAGVHAMGSVSVGGNGHSINSEDQEQPAKGGKLCLYKGTYEKEMTRESLTLQQDIQADTLSAEYAIVTYDVNGVVEGKIPAAVHSLAATRFQQSLQSLLDLHKEQVLNGCPLIWSLEEFQDRTRSATPKMIKLLTKFGIKEERRVRIKTGCYLTRVDLPTAIVVLRSSKILPAGVKNLDSTNKETVIHKELEHKEELEMLKTLHGLKLEEETSFAHVLYAVCGEKEFSDKDHAQNTQWIQEKLKCVVSPLSSGLQVQKTVFVSPTAIVVEVSLQNNFFFIMHGHRMKSQYPPFTAEEKHLTDQFQADTTIQGQGQSRAAAAARAQQEGADAGGVGGSSSLEGMVRLSDEQVEEKTSTALVQLGCQATLEAIRSHSDTSNIPEKRLKKALKSVAKFDRSTQQYVLK